MIWFLSLSYDQEVGSCDFGREDYSAARIYEEGADVAGADCCQ